MIRARMAARCQEAARNPAAGGRSRRIAYFLAAAAILAAAISSSCSPKPPAPEPGVSRGPPSKNAMAPWPTKIWSVSKPEDQGMDFERLEKANERIIDNYFSAYSLLVIRNGYLVFEKYYQGSNRDAANPIYSVTKSVVSALTGIAVREKLIGGVEQKAADLLPGYFSRLEDQGKREITVKNILTMTGGLESIDSDYYSYSSSGDWIGYALNKPLIEKPGAKFVYNTGLTHLLSGIIAVTAKISAERFANKFLFGPLGIRARRWEKDAKGFNGGGYGLWMTPRDLAKLGYLYLRGGQWDGKQIIPKEWIDASVAKQVSVDPVADYGYSVWLWSEKAKLGDRTYFSFGFCGAGGQNVIVIPGLDLIAVTTAGYTLRSMDNTVIADLIWDYVVPAVKAFSP